MRIFKTFLLFAGCVAISTSAFAEIRQFTCRQGSSAVKLTVDTSNLRNLILEPNLRPDVQLIPGMPYQMFIAPAVDVIEAQNPGLKVTASRWSFECNL